MNFEEWYSDYLDIGSYTDALRDAFNAGKVAEREERDEMARKAILGPGAPRKGHYGYDGPG